MYECEYCGETEIRINKCKVCGARFCEYCGSSEDKVCINCMEEENFEDEEKELVSSKRTHKTLLVARAQYEDEVKEW